MAPLQPPESESLAEATPVPATLVTAPTAQPSATDSRSGRWWSRRFSGAVLVIAVLVGIQVGSIPWRFRREIWQFQGFLVGALVGYLAGTYRSTGDRARLD